MITYLEKGFKSKSVFVIKSLSLRAIGTRENLVGVDYSIRNRSCLIVSKLDEKSEITALEDITSNLKFRNDEFHTKRAIDTILNKSNLL